MGVPLSVSAAREISILRETAGYLGPSPHIPYVPDVEELVLAAEKQSGGTTTGFVEASARLVRSRFRYRSGVTHAGSSIVDLLKSKAGVCQDFAHLLIAICRWRGVPARYVSGYLAPGYLSDPSYQGDRLFRAAAGHAWVEFFSPGAGWLGIDPTLGSPPAHRHITIACGRDYSDAAPVTGVYQGPEWSSVQSMIEICCL
jgi:transglutaminase-like putative cysteine protease